MTAGDAIEHVEREPIPGPPPGRSVWQLGAIVGAAGAIGAGVAASPMAGVLVAAVVLALLLVVARPEYAAATVAFLLWANVPVVAMREHGVPKTVASAYVLLLLVPAIRSLIVERRKFILQGALPWVVMYLGFSLVSTALSRDPARSLESSKELLLEGVVIFVLIGLALRDRESLRRVTWALMAAGAFMGLVALAQQLTGRFDSNFGGFGLVDSGFGTGEVSTRGEVTQARLAGPIGEKNRFGQIMLVPVALGTGLARAEARASLKRLAYAAAGLSAIGAALTFSRGNAVALVLLLFVMAAIGTVSRRQLGGLILAGAVLLLALPQYRARLATLPSVLLLAQTTPTAKSPDGAILGRATEVVAAVLVYFDHPVLGVGPGLFKTYSAEYGNKLGLRRLKSEREAHTLLPHVAAEGGTLGLGAFSGVLLVIMLGLFRKTRNATDPRDRELASGYFLGLSAYLLCGLFLHMAFIRYFWFLAGIASAAVALPADAEDEVRSLPARLEQ